MAIKKILLSSSILAVVIAVVFSLEGCGRNKEPKEEIIARINNYQLTARDFVDEAKIVVPPAVLAANPSKAKEYTMKELVTKKILLQEAQKLDLDKDRKFVKEIERYWEQALLKLLIQKKVDELSKALSPDLTGEARQKALQSELLKWIESTKKTAKIKIDDNVYRKVEIK